MNNMTTTDEAAIALINAVALAPCLNQVFNHATNCACNGSGYHPLSELLRVECIAAKTGQHEKYWCHPDRKKRWPGGGQPPWFYDDCPNWNVATPDEAEAAFHGLLLAFLTRIYPGSYTPT